jgi:hypothetical protein
LAPWPLQIWPAEQQMTLAPLPQHVPPWGQHFELAPEPQQICPVEQQIVALQQKNPDPQSVLVWQDFGAAKARPGAATVARAAPASPPRIRRNARRRDIGLASARAISSNSDSSLIF